MLYANPPIYFKRIRDTRIKKYGIQHPRKLKSNELRYLGRKEEESYTKMPASEKEEKFHTGVKC